MKTPIVNCYECGNRMVYLRTDHTRPFLSKKTNKVDALQITCYVCPFCGAKLGVNAQSMNDILDSAKGCLPIQS